MIETELEREMALEELDGSVTLGQVAFEAAKAATGCDKQWQDANQKKWEAAGLAVWNKANRRAK